MDAHRFDNLARTLARRFSRRNALRSAGVGAAASVFAAAGIRPEQAAALARAQEDGQPLYTMIRRYTLDGPTGRVRRALQQGYVDDACKAPGFVAYLTVEDEDGDFATVAVFRSRADLENFAASEANWVARNLGDLLPAPDEAISGDTYVHGVATQGFTNTCPPPPAPVQPTAAPTQPTTAPAQPTAVPPAPTTTPTPAPCTAEGCVCATGTQSPCDDGLVCCPTTDLLGGPGVCQTQAVCYPNSCRANGRACPRSCSTDEACPNCCSNYCNADGVCDDQSVACTGEGCTCATGTQGACDAGLVCCGMAGGLPGSQGTCLTEAECATPCTGQGCDCDNTDPNACDAGLVCCAVQSGFICATEEQCGITPTPAPCTGEGCTCASGTLGACDDGLICCAQGDPGAPGTCQTEANCPGSICTDVGCPCNGGVQNACRDGLVCCQEGESIPGGPGTCQPAEACGPTCTSNGGGCDATCNWGDDCGGCCSGYCNDNGICDDEPVNTCIPDGQNCGNTCSWSDGCDACCSGFCDGAGNCNEPGASAGACGDEGCGCQLGNSACVGDLLCCDDGSGVTGTCQPSC